MSDQRPDPTSPTDRRVDVRRAANDRRQATVTSAILSAPFGAHILGLTDPSPISAHGAVRAYMKAAND